MIPLTKIPGISHGLDFIATKFRLFVEYVMIGLIITLLGACFTIYIKKLHTDIELGKVATTAAFLDDANQTNLLTIAELQKDNKKSSDAVMTLIRRNQEIQSENFAMQQKIDALEGSDEQVKDYLNTNIPVSLQCLLNTECQNGNQNGTDKAAPTGGVVASY